MGGLYIDEKLCKGISKSVHILDLSTEGDYILMKLCKGINKSVRRLDLSTKVNVTDYAWF